MPGFCDKQGTLRDIFVTDAELIDRFVGNQLWAWGCAGLGQLANSSTFGILSSSSPIQTVSGGTNWSKVSGTWCTVGAIKTDGTLWLWGLGSDGIIGNNNTINQSSPVQTISSGTNWKEISVGFRHSAAIKTDGTLWAWGNGNNGQLGNNTLSPSRSSPVQTVSAGKNWKLVSAKLSSTAAIKTDGTLWLWGSNNTGSLGNNSTIERSSPVQTISGGTNWKFIDSHGATVAIKTDGTLWLWGQGSNGGLGNNSVAYRSSPVQTISSGTNWRCATTMNVGVISIKTDGTLWLWGSGTSGQLGNNSNINHSSPIQTVSGGTNWKMANRAGSHTAAIKTDGTLWLWGRGDNGVLGNNCGGGVNTTRSSPVQTIGRGRNWKQVSIGCYLTTAVTFTDQG